MKIPGKSIADRVKFARGQAGLTQQALADAADIPIRTLQDIEYGKTAEPGLISGINLARALGVSVEELTGLEASKTGIQAKDSTFSDAARLLLAYEKAPRHVREFVDRVLETGDIGDIHAAQAALSQLAQSLQTPKPKKS